MSIMQVYFYYAIARNNLTLVGYLVGYLVCYLVSKTKQNIAPT